MRRSLLLLPFVSLVVAAPVPKETETDKLYRHFGSPVDPAKDCKFTLDGTKLTVNVGKGDHDLSVQSNEMNAPRVLKEIEGDFTVSVKVSGDYPKGAKGASEKRTIAFYGAGILVWNDEKNYVRLEKAYVDGLNGTPVNCYGSWELFAGGEWLRRGTNEDYKYDPKDTAYLKLSRKGNVFTAAMSKDGKEWRELDEIEAEMGKTLKVGVCAVHICDTGFDAVFDDYQLKADKVKEQDKKPEEKKPEEKKDQ
jgi:regulation of enolase protein 1 (concanavalin A-like superfamily)